MPRALQMAGGNPYKARIDQTVAFVALRFRQRKAQAVPEWELRQYLSKLIIPNMVDIVINQCVASKQLRVIAGVKAPHREFKPGVEL